MTICGTLVSGACLSSAIYIALWTLNAIIAAIYFDTWLPKIGLTEIQLITFNVTKTSALDTQSSFALDADLNVTVEARHYSRHPSIDRVDFLIATSYQGNSAPNYQGVNFGSCRTPRMRRHGGYNDTLTINCEVKLQGYAISDTDGADLQDQIGKGILLLEVYTKAKISAPSVFLLYRKGASETCKILMRPPSTSLPAKVLDSYCT
ncbi:unnamed protein product [Sphagnum balticum]